MPNTALYQDDDKADRITQLAWTLFDDTDPKPMLSGADGDYRGRLWSLAGRGYRLCVDLGGRQRAGKPDQL